MLHIRFVFYLLLFGIYNKMLWLTYFDHQQSISLNIFSHFRIGKDVKINKTKSTVAKWMSEMNLWNIHRDIESIGLK